MARRRGEDFTVMSEAAQLMSFGDGADMVVAALAGELAARLALADCRFERGPPTGDRPCVARDGRLVDLGDGLGNGRRPTWATDSARRLSPRSISRSGQGWRW